MTESAYRVWTGRLDQEPGPDLFGGPQVVACSPDHRLVAVGGYNDGHAATGQLGVWDVEEQAWRFVVEPEFPGASSVVFPPGTDLMIVGGAEIPAMVEAFSLADGEHRWSTVLTEPVQWLRDQELIDDDEDLYDQLLGPYADWLEDRDEVYDHFGPVHLGTDGHGGYTVVVAPGYGAVAVLETTTGRCDYFHRGQARCAAISHSGDRFAVGTFDGRLTIHAIPSGGILSEHRTGLDRVDAVAFAPDGTHLLSAGLAGDRLRLCQLDGSPTVDPALQPGDADSVEVVWSTAGPRVHLGPIVLDGTDGRPLLNLRGRANESCTALSPDGQFLLTADREVRAWLVDQPPGEDPAGPDPGPEIHRLLDVVARTSGDDRETARTELVALFSYFPTDDPTVADARRKLASLLF